jgi:hypothetical protein
MTDALYGPLFRVSDDREATVKLALAIIQNTLDVDPSRVYYVGDGMPRPDCYLVQGEQAFAFGPDGYLWVAQMSRLRGIAWHEATNLHFHYLDLHGELYKFRASGDDEFLHLVCHAAYLSQALIQCTPQTRDSKLPRRTR